MLRYDFWCADATQAAGTMRDLFATAAKETIRLADDACVNRFTFRGHWEMERTHEAVDFGDVIEWNHTENNDPEWCYAFNRHSFFVLLGKAWRLTGDEKYPAAFARLIEDWIDRVPLTKEARETTWRPIEAGLRCESWLRALALFEDSGAPDGRLLQKIEGCLREHGEYLIESHTTFQRLSNWGVLQDHGLFLLGLALDKPEWRDIAAERLSGELHLQVFRDGSHWEQSPLYHCEVLHCCLDTMLAADRTGYGLKSGFKQAVYKMSRALADWLRPDGLLVCQSDSDEVDARDLLALAALLFADESLKGAAADRCYEENLWDFADRLAQFEALPCAYAHKSVALPDTGNYMLLDGEGENAGWMHFHCGCIGSGHGHADQLHIDLVSRGETVLLDSGRYTYVPTELRKLLKSPEAHNCVVVDGHSFTEPEGSWGYNHIAQYLKGEHCFTPDADYVSAAHLGFMDIGVLHQRQVLRLGKDLWIALDTFEAGMREQAHLYQHYYHFGPEGDAQVDGNGAVYNGERVSARLVLAGVPLELTMSKAPGSREYNKLEPHDCLCASHTGCGFRSLAAVVATGVPGKQPKLTVKMEPVILEADGRKLASDEAQALCIHHGVDKWTVIFSHHEVFHGVDLLSAAGQSGYGRVLVFGPPLPEGVCLAW